MTPPERKQINTLGEALNEYIDKLSEQGYSTDKEDLPYTFEAVGAELRAYYSMYGRSLNIDLLENGDIVFRRAMHSDFDRVAFHHLPIRTVFTERAR